MTPDETPLKANYDKIYKGGSEDSRRRRIESAVISLAVATLFGLLSTLWIVTTVQSNVSNDALIAAHHNCSSLRASRLAGNAFRFGIREELAFIPDLISASQKKAKHHKLDKESAAFLAAEVARLNADLQSERKLGTPGLPAHISGFADLFSLFADTKPLNCSTSTLTHR